MTNNHKDTDQTTRPGARLKIGDAPAGMSHGIRLSNENVEPPEETPRDSAPASRGLPE